jgi:hypothetical protein
MNEPPRRVSAAQRARPPVLIRLGDAFPAQREFRGFLVAVLFLRVAWVYDGDEPAVLGVDDLCIPVRVPEHARSPAGNDRRELWNPFGSGPRVPGPRLSRVSGPVVSGRAAEAAVTVSKMVRSAIVSGSPPIRSSASSASGPSHHVRYEGWGISAGHQRSRPLRILGSARVRTRHGVLRQQPAEQVPRCRALVGLTYWRACSIGV